jgi:hypothetical protein
MMQGYIANNDAPISLLFSNVPSGTYALVVYSVGFSFNSTYEEDFSLLGATTYPTLTVLGQNSLEFIANPTLVRMSSTNSASRDHGNYVMFENISPALDGTLLLTVTPQSTNVGNASYFPPVNALQLVKVVSVATPASPSLTIAPQGAAALTISWNADAAGFVLQSSATLSAGSSWTTVPGTPNPITVAGSANINTTSNAQFYRLRK